MALRVEGQDVVSIPCGDCGATHASVEERTRCWAWSGQPPQPANGTPNLADRALGPTRTVTLVTASDVQPERARWVDDGRIPLGSLSLAAGEPGLGKSMFACGELAARVSRGQAGGDLDGPGHVVIASAEDSRSHTLRPRLMAAGADLELVHFVRVTEDDTPGTLSLPSDVDQLWALAKDVDAKLVIVDPVAAHLDGAVDSHRDASTRKALAPLATMADELGCAVLGVVHVNKSDARSLFLRVGGSLAFFAAARSVMLVARDPADPDEHSASRVLVHGKCNVGPLAVARRFTVESRTVASHGELFATAGITWAGDAPDVTPSSALAGPVDEDERSERTEAEQWLRELLDELGEVEAAEAKQAGRKAGIAERTLERARRKIGAVSRRRGFGKGAKYVWTMPDADDKQSPGEADEPHARHVNHSPETGEHGDHDGEHVSDATDSNGDKGLPL